MSNPTIEDLKNDPMFEVRVDIDGMLHHIDRILTPQESGKLNKLDEERLSDALLFLSDQISVPVPEEDGPQAFLFAAFNEPAYKHGSLSEEVFNQALEANEGLLVGSNWRKTPESKLTGMIDAVGQFVERLEQDLSQEDVPEKELRAIRAILASMQTKL